MDCNSICSDSDIYLHVCYKDIYSIRIFISFSFMFLTSFISANFLQIIYIIANKDNSVILNLSFLEENNSFSVEALLL